MADFLSDVHRFVGLLGDLRSVLAKRGQFKSARVERRRISLSPTGVSAYLWFIRLKRAQPTIATQDCATEGVPVPLLCSAISGRSNRRFDAGRTGLRGGWLEQRGGTGTCPPLNFPPSQVRFRRMNLIFVYLLFHEGGHSLAEITFGRFDLRAATSGESTASRIRAVPPRGRNSNRANRPSYHAWGRCCRPSWDSDSLCCGVFRWVGSCGACSQW